MRCPWRRPVENRQTGAAPQPHYTVLGAGIVGACYALALRQEGFPVTLIDRDAPGLGSSYGNAGVIQTGMPIPDVTPGMMHALPRYLTDPQSPLSDRSGVLRRRDSSSSG